jgi:hypothetical protein
MRSDRVLFAPSMSIQLLQYLACGATFFSHGNDIRLVESPWDGRLLPASRETRWTTFYVNPSFPPHLSPSDLTIWDTCAREDYKVFIAVWTRNSKLTIGMSD